MTFAPWAKAQTFNVTLNSAWSVVKGKSFRVEFGYSGSNAASYALQPSDYVKFTVQAAATVPAPTVTLSKDNLAVTKFGFSTTGTVSDPGVVFSLVLPAGQTGPTAG